MVIPDTYNALGRRQKRIRPQSSAFWGSVSWSMSVYSIVNMNAPTLLAVLASTATIDVRYNLGMEPVRGKEIQAEILAHILDDVISIPGTQLRFGIDPIVGLIPVVGDVLTVVCGSFILLTARQLGVPRQKLVRMMYYLLLNGVIGAIPVFGDCYSFGFKSYTKNCAVLVRALRKEEGTACRSRPPHSTYWTSA